MAKKQSSKKEDKNIEEKIKELKVELLKHPTKRKGIKKEIARLLTLKTKQSAPSKEAAEKTNK